MINDALSGGGMYSNAKVHVSNNTDTEDVKRQEILEKQAEALSEILKEDTVEISDEARALYDAARTSSETVYETQAQVQETEEEISNPEAAQESSILDSVNTTKTEVQEQYSTTEARDKEGARLDDYLNELRKKYGEEKAMALFTEYMESEGYEITDPGMPPIIGGKTTIRPYDVATSGYKSLGTPNEDALRSLKLNSDGTIGGGITEPHRGTCHVQTDRANSNFTLYSTLNTTTKDGGISHNAETWAQYDALISTDKAEIYEQWKQRNVDELTEEAGFDMAQYLDSFMSTMSPWGKSFAAESVNFDLADTMNSILSDAGIELESGQNMTLRLDDFDNRLYVNLNFGDEALREKVQSSIDRAIKKDPGILQAFKAEDASVKQQDISQLDGTFDNGVQSNSYLQQRSFLLSGDEPSAVVMGSGLTNVSTGYTFRKKVSDSFDESADLIKFSGSADSFASWVEQREATMQYVDELKQKNA